MKAKHIIALILTTGISANVYAAPDKGPQDVNVVNDATNPVPVTVQNPMGEVQFVGFSDDTVQGGVGIIGMHTACRNKFGLGARMCRTIEVFKTTNLEPIPGVAGWIAPHVLNMDTDTTHCTSWSTSGFGSGQAIIGDSMTIQKFGCSNLFPVACCK